MIGALASLLVIAAGAVLVGQAVLGMAGRRDLHWLAGPIGLAGLVAVAGVAVRAPGHVTTAVVALAGVIAVAGATLVLLRPAGLARVRASLPAALLAVLGAALPFLAAGAVGVLGVGLVNDDMASHLLMTAWLDERFSPEPVLIDQGYPLGPHALVAAISQALGIDRVEGFAGLTLAIPALTAMLAFGALDGLGRVWRTLSAAATAIPYLVAAYLAQEAFKEPVIALFVLAFALWLPHVKRGRDGIPLGLLAAGTVYTYSFPGLVWLAGAALVWALVEAIRAGGVPLARRLAAPAGVAALVVVALIAPEVARLREFVDFRALDPDRANEGGLGNLRGHISPLEALGIWPTSEFRLAAGAGSLPAVVFYAGAAVGALALALGLPAWIRRYGTAVPAALGAALVIYIGARAFGTVYTSAKALAIAAPLVTLIALGGLFQRTRGVRTGEAGPSQPAHAPAEARTASRYGYRAVVAGRYGYRRALATTYVLLAITSSFLILRQAPVGPTAHGDELARMRPIVAGERVLFLGRDNFVLYHLRGSRPFTHVRNFYDPYFVKPNFDLRDVGSKFDFDAVEARKLARFPYVITTRAAYASGPPPGYTAELATDSYVLWKAGGDARGRRPVETGPAPTARLRCRGNRPPGTAAVLRDEPIVAGGWSPSATLESGAPASVSIDLPRGRWLLSLPYDSTRPVTLSAPGLNAKLPGNLDYRGVAPHWAAGEIDVRHRGPVEIEAEVEDPPLAGRLMGARSVAHLGAVAATPATRGYIGGLELPHPGAATALMPAREACGLEADWTAPERR